MFKCPKCENASFCAQQKTKAGIIIDNSGSFGENSAARTPVQNRKQKPKN